MSVNRLTLNGMSTASSERVPEITRGWRLKIALSYAGMKAEDMAAHLGMSRQTITRWMTDQGAPPRPVYVREWARLTGVSLAWLESGTAPGAPTPSPDGQAPPDKLAALTDAKRRRVARRSSPTIGVCVGLVAA